MGGAKQKQNSFARYRAELRCLALRDLLNSNLQMIAAAAVVFTAAEFGIRCAPWPESYRLLATGFLAYTLAGFALFGFISAMIEVKHKLRLETWSLFFRTWRTTVPALLLCVLWVPLLMAAVTAAWSQAKMALPTGS